MEICHLITTISRGGAENQLLILVRKQIEAGNSVTIFPLKGKLDLMKDFISIGANINISLHNKNYFFQICKLYVTNFKNYDVLHMHLPQAELLAIWIKHGNKIVTRHFGSSFFPGKPILVSKLLSRLATAGARRVIAISSFVSEYLVKSREVKNVSKIHIVRYGFDAVGFNNTLGHKPIPRNHPKIFGTLARLSPEKDLKTLILGFHSYIKKSNDDAILKIFGEGKLNDELQELIDKLDLSESVKLMGKTDYPAMSINEFDVFVLTSLFEGFGMVLLEAMALSKPVICSRIGAAEEVMSDNGAAVYFKVSDYLDLADKMTNLSTYLNPNYRNLQSERLREFSAEKMSTEIQKLYTEISPQGKK